MVSPGQTQGNGNDREKPVKKANSEPDDEMDIYAVYASCRSHSNTEVLSTTVCCESESGGCPDSQSYGTTIRKILFRNADLRNVGYIELSCNTRSGHDN